MQDPPYKSPSLTARPEVVALKKERFDPIDPSDITSALEAILESPAFGKVERPSRFLRFLVEMTLRGETDRLKETVLGVEIFGRPPDWDPRLDAIVRQEAGRLRKRLARYYDSAQNPQPVRIDLPVGTYVPQFVRCDPSLAEAPSVPIETTPEKPASRAPLYLALGTLLVLGLLGLLIRRVWSGPTPEPASVAVLPFTNLSADPANQYFADGLTDEITDLLARNKMLRVVARSSASLFRAKAADIADVGRKLNVANILQGSVERSGNRIKIIAHLERTSDSSYLWSNTFERQASDLFAVQSELAAAIAGSLKASSGLRTAQPHVPQSAAMEWFMKGRYELQQNTPQSVTRAEEDFQRAIDADPGYAPSYAALAAAKYNQAPARVGDRTETERRESERLARRALELDPTLAGPHSLLASLAMQYEWDWKRAEKELQSAMSSTPDAGAETTYAALLIIRGRSAEAEPHIERALDLDPFGVGTLANVVSARYLEGRVEQRREIARKLQMVAPQMVSAQLMNLAIYVEEGHPEQAWPEFKKLEQRFPAAAVSEAWSRARIGQKEEALQILRPFEEKYPNQGVPLQGFALVYGLLGDESNALKWLERSADAREWQALNLAVNPAFRSMEGSAGFHALKRRMALE